MIYTSPSPPSCNFIQEPLGSSYMLESFCWDGDWHSTEFISAMNCHLFFFLVLPIYCYQPISLHPRAHMLSHVIPWTSARQTPLSIDFSRQEYWSGLPFPSPWTAILMAWSLSTRDKGIQALIHVHWSSFIIFSMWKCLFSAYFWVLNIYVMIFFDIIGENWTQIEYCMILGLIRVRVNLCWLW